MICNICNTTYSGGVCPACGAVYTTEKHEHNIPVHQYLDNVRDILWLEQVLHKYMITRAVVLVIAMVLGWLCSLGKPFIFFAGYTVVWYAGLSLLSLPGKKKKWPNQVKVIEAITNGAVCLVMLWFTMNYAEIVQGMFIGKILPVLILILLAFLPIAAIKGLWRASIGKIHNASITKEHWKNFITKLGKESYIPKQWRSQAETLHPKD